MRLISYSIAEADEMLANSSGDNRKGILVIFRPVGDENPPELLRKILQAAGISPADDTLLLPYEEGRTYSITTLATVMSVRDVLVFGVSPAAIGLHWQPAAYVPIVVGERRYLFSHDMEYLGTPKNKAAKGKLWQALKAMYKPIG